MQPGRRLDDGDPLVAVRRLAVNQCMRLPGSVEKTPLTRQSTQRQPEVMPWLGVTCALKVFVSAEVRLVA